MEQLRSQSLANIHIDEIRREADPHQVHLAKRTGSGASRAGRPLRQAIRAIATGVNAATIGRGRSAHGQVR